MGHQYRASRWTELEICFHSIPSSKWHWGWNPSLNWMSPKRSSTPYKHKIRQSTSGFKKQHQSPVLQPQQLKNNWFHLTWSPATLAVIGWWVYISDEDPEVKYIPGPRLSSRFVYHLTPSSKWELKIHNMCFKLVVCISFTKKMHQLKIIRSLMSVW